MSSQEIEKARDWATEQKLKRLGKQKEVRIREEKEKIKISLETWLKSTNLKSTQKQRNNVVELAFHINEYRIMSLENIEKSYDGKLKEAEDDRDTKLRALKDSQEKITSFIAKSGIPEAFFIELENVDIKDYKGCLEDVLLENGSETFISDNEKAIELAMERSKLKPKHEIESEFNGQKDSLGKEKVNRIKAYNDIKEEISELTIFSDFINKYLAKNSST
ncbi:MAG: hypothetical protein HYY37_05060 [Candidatus Aenigmarchaeota archaeon]|nr:hypothetical protein [Candidatus Aenigmarchaeota archaeon]